MIELFSDNQPFLEEASVSPATVNKLLAILQDPQEKKLLQVELAVTVDAGMPFVRATYMYNLEGDGPLALSSYYTIRALNVSARQAHYPNLDAIAAQIAGGNAQEKSELLHHAKKCVEPGITYYFHQISTNMKTPLEGFKAARLFSPFRLSEINPSITNIDCLASFPFLAPEIQALKQELPHYYAAAQDIDLSLDPLVFWKHHKNDLPTWAKAVRHVLLVQPSSAASERVFPF